MNQIHVTISKSEFSPAEAGFGQQQSLVCVSSPSSVQANYASVETLLSACLRDGWQIEFTEVLRIKFSVSRLSQGERGSKNHQAASSKASKACEARLGLGFSAKFACSSLFHFTALFCTLLHYNHYPFSVETLTLPSGLAHCQGRELFGDRFFGSDRSPDTTSKATGD